MRGTALALMRLGYLGLGPEHPAVRAGAERLFAAQRADGAWELREDASPGSGKSLDDGENEGEGAGHPEGYSMIPLQTAIPLRGLAACGYATDPRAERAYDWLLAQRLPDGAWPTGIASGNYGGVGGYRRLAHSRWGCRSNTTGALICLAYHPTRRQSAEARRALDLLLGRETQEQQTLGFEVARLIGLEPFRGRLTFYARFDLALLLDLCGRIGATRRGRACGGADRDGRGLPRTVWPVGVPTSPAGRTLGHLRPAALVGAHRRQRRMAEQRAAHPLPELRAPSEAFLKGARPALSGRDRRRDRPARVPRLHRAG